MGSDPSDPELLRLARRGDRGAFAALISRHYPVLLACCRRVVADTELARDAAQQATLTAMLGLARLRDDERFGSWLIGIGLNVSRTLLRDRARQSAAIQALAHDRRPGEIVTDPAQRAKDEDISARVRAAIKSLPAGQRDAVALYYIAGLTQAEIAEHLGTVPGAIKTRLHKARRALRASLNQLWKEDFVPAGKTNLVPMRILDLRRTAAAEPDWIRNIVVLEEEGGHRRLSIWIGDAEATSLAVMLEEVEVPRPWTHQFAASLLRAAGGQLREIRIVELTDSTFYAQAILTDGTEVDGRPSDALTLALHVDAPIYVARAVLDETASESSSVAGAQHPREGSKAIAQEARRRLNAEAEMLESLRS